MTALRKAETPAFDAEAQLQTVRRALEEDRLIPYLGPGLLELDRASAPASPEAVAAALHQRAPRLHESGPTCGPSRSSSR